MSQPVYISMEGLDDSSSPSEDEELLFNDDRLINTARKDFPVDENVYKEETGSLHNFGEELDNAGKLSKESEDNILALSKKQLNRLAAMDIYAIPSGGIGTVNASLFNPVTIQWLMKNFETVEGSSLPRYLVYSHYLLHCKSFNLKPINAASFGKVIRSVFLGLQTRRLGTRGNSKYHYCGMQIKADSPLLNVVMDDAVTKRIRHVPDPKEEKTGAKKSVVKSESTWTAHMFELWKEKYMTQVPEDYILKRYHGMDVPRNLKIATDYSFPISEVNKDEVFAFKWFYEAHCQILVDVVTSLQLEQVGIAWQQFYDLDWDKLRCFPSKTQNFPKEFIMNLKFTRSRMKKLVSGKDIQTYINEADKLTYGVIFTLLSPEVTSNVPVAVNDGINSFLAVAETWLLDSLSSYPEDFKSMKLKTLQDTVRPLQHALHTNRVFSYLQEAIEDSEKIEDFQTAIDQSHFRHLDAQINWITQGLVPNFSRRLKHITQQSDIPLAIVDYVESVVAKKIDLNESLKKTRIKMHHFFLALNYGISYMKTKFVFIGESALQLLAQIEEFLLAYFKFCTNQWTHKQTQPSLQEQEAETWKKELVVLQMPSGHNPDVHKNALPKIGNSDVLADTWFVEHNIHRANLEDLKEFLGKGGVADETEDDSLITDATAEDPLNIDESFSSYFSASGYVTNYFSSGFSHLDIAITDDIDGKCSDDTMP